MKIGIFDSGYGGLSVLHYAKKTMPGTEFIYYADEAHVPYGEKSNEEVTGYVDGIISFLLEKGVEAIVIACNTATSAAAAKMREKYSIPIIGMEPAVKKAMDLYGSQKVLVVATPITVKGKKMHDLIERVDQEHLSDLAALPELVHFAENMIFSTEQVVPYLEEALSEFALEDYSSVVLGCTHFNYFKDSFKEILPKGIHFVDGVEGTVHHLIECISYMRDECAKPADVNYYSSGEAVTSKEEKKRLSLYMERLDEMELL